MSIYPVPVSAQELYTTSTTKKHALGTRAIFQTDNGPVEAVYVKWNNATSAVQGLAVHQSATPWAVNTAIYGATNPAIGAGALVGVLCAPVAATTVQVDYVWAAFRGPITAINVAATAASSNHNGVLYQIQAGSANAVSVVSTLDTTAGSVLARNHILGIGGGATTTIATTGGAGPAYINLFWR